MKPGPDNKLLSDPSASRADESPEYRVEVVLAMPGFQYLMTLSVEPGTTARGAVRLAMQAGLVPSMAAIDVDPALAPLGIFGERVADEHVCQPGERVEIYRPLHQDPKELRRLRARQSS